MSSVNAKVVPFDEALTFTRASTATYWDKDGVLQTAAVDEPRFDHDPVTGEPLGALFEGQEASNYFPESNGDPAGWDTFSGSSVRQTSDDLGPDFPAHKLTATASESIEVRHRFSVGGDEVPRWMTIIIKNYGCARLWVRETYTVRFTVEAELVDGYEGEGGNLFVTGLGNDYFRIDYFFDNWNNNSSPLIRGLDAEGSNVGEGLGFSLCYLGVTDRLSNPIKTSGSAVTQSAEVPSRNVGAEFNYDALTFLVHFEALGDYHNLRYVLSYESGSLDRLNIGLANDSSFAVFNRRNGVQDSLPLSNNADLSVGGKLAVSIWKSGIRAAFNGVTIEDMTANVNMGPLDSILIGYTHSALKMDSIHIKRLEYIPNSRTAAQLEAMTA